LAERYRALRKKYSQIIEIVAPDVSVIKVSSTPYEMYLFKTTITKIGGTSAKRLAAKEIYPNSNASDGLDARFVKSRSI
jgi:hypothetical protein